MIKKVVLITVSLFLFCSAPAKAELSIDITGAHSSPMAVGLPSFSASGLKKEKSKEYAKKIARVIESDLESSGLFRILDPVAYLQSFKGIEDAPAFVDWQAISAEALIQGHVDYLSAKQIRVSVRLWDVYAAQEMYSATLEIDTKATTAAAIGEQVIPTCEAIDATPQGRSGRMPFLSAMSQMIGMRVYTT